jgi:hypothetical protein
MVGATQRDEGDAGLNWIASTPLKPRGGRGGEGECDKIW